MRNILTIALALLCLTTVAQTRVTCQFNNQSLSKALIALNKMQQDYRINFVYDELEDFTVTTNINSLTVPQAVDRVVGYYPMRVTQRDSIIYVECVQKAATKLRGRIVDEAGQPLSFATVTLLSPVDSAYINSGVAGEDGRFVIPCEAAQVIARFTFVGYKTIFRNTRVRNMGTIAMTTDSQVLSETVIEGSRFIQKADRYIVIPDSAIIARSTGPIDVLHQLQLPGLEINLALKQMTINGGEVVYKVNGMPRELRDIYTINPNQILRIEYSDNPGIRYSDREAGGVINFILKERPTGGSLFESLLVSPNAGMADNNFKMTYNHKKSQFALSHYFQRRDYNDEWHNAENTYIGGGDTIRREIKGDASHFDYWLNNVDASYTYQQDQNTGFQASYSLQCQPRNRRYPSQTVETVNGALTNRYISNSDAKDRYLNHALDLFFGKKFNATSSLEAQLVGRYASNRNKGMLTYDYQDGQGTQTYLSGVDNSHYSVIGEVSYSHEFEKMTLSVGNQDTWTRALNDYVSGTSTRLRSNNNFTYVELKGKWKERYNWSAGTGVKVFWVDNGERRHTFVNNRTTVRFGGQPFKGFTFNAAASFYPRLPSLGDMDSVTQVVDNIVAVAGTPSLTPSRRFRTSLWARYTWSKLMLRYQCTVDYERHPLYSYTYYDPASRYFVRQMINGKYYIGHQSRLTVSLRDLWDCLTLTANAYYTPVATDAGALFHHRYDMWYYKLDADLYLGKFAVNIFWSPRDKSLWGERISIEGSNLGARLQYMPNKRLSFELQGIWIGGRGDYYETHSLSSIAPSHSTQVIRDNATTVRLGVTYNLDFGRKFQQGKRTLYNSDNSTSATTIN